MDGVCIFDVAFRGYDGFDDDDDATRLCSWC